MCMNVWDEDKCFVFVKDTYAIEMGDYFYVPFDHMVNLVNDLRFIGYKEREKEEDR